MKIVSSLLLMLLSLVLLGVAKADDDKPKEEEGEDGVKEKEVKPKFIMQGWLKYLQTKIGGPKLPQKFLVNTNFGHQMMMNATTDLISTDDWGYMNIPDDHHFFFMMDEFTLYMVNARTNDLAKTQLSVDFHMLKEREVPEGDEEETGGVLDIGDFKEGYCFKLVSKTGVEWTMCADQPNDKIKWLKMIRQFVLIKEKVSMKGGAGSLTADNAPIGIPPGFEYGAGDSFEGKEIPKDGQWVVLQTWTECTLACGGGKSYMHRMCIPPVNGGLPCMGQAVLAETCNEMPCPEPSDPKVKPKLLDPLVRVVPISNRFQRFEMCIIKEGDLLVQLPYEKGGYFLELPVRVILNNRTISIFPTSKYNNIYKSFDLPLLSVEMDGRKDYKKRCFTLQDSRDQNKHETLCTMPQALRAGESQEGVKNQWMKDILTFKDQCQVNVTYTDDNDSSFVAGLKKDLSSDIDEQQNINLRVDKLQVKDSNIEHVSTTAVSALDTEVKYERLKREELSDLTELMQLQLRQAVDAEKKQEIACVKSEASQEKKELIRKMEMEKKEVEEDFKKTEKTTILHTRSKANFQMDKDKLIAARKLKAQKERLFLLKEKIGKEVVDENRSGDKKKCDPKTPEDKQKAFCEKTFAKRPYVYVDCIKGPTQFCLGCCEHEYGSLVLDMREECYRMCFEYEFPKKEAARQAEKANPGWIQLQNSQKVPNMAKGGEEKKSRFMKRTAPVDDEE